MLLNAILQSSLRIAASLVHENCSGSKQFDVWATDYMFSAETSLGAIEPVPRGRVPAIGGVVVAVFCIFDSYM